MDIRSPSGYGPATAASPKEQEQAKKGIAVSYQFVGGIAPGNASQLFLLVDGGWRFLNNPDFATVYSVQEAFCGSSDRLEVEVHFRESTDEIVAVKVMTK